MGEHAVWTDSELDSYDMLKALYDFKATFAKTISFCVNDYFILHQVSTKQKNWWHVVNAKGQVGYVPSNYITSIKVSIKFWVEFLDGCIKALSEESRKTNRHSGKDKYDLLLWLMHKRRTANPNLDEKQSPLSKLDFTCSVQPLAFQQQKPYTDSVDGDFHSLPSSSTLSSCTETGDQGDGDESAADNTNHPKKQVRHSIHMSMSDISQRRSCGLNDEPDVRKSTSNVAVVCPSSIPATPARTVPCNKPVATPTSTITPEVVYQVLEEVRKHTQLSHEMSRVAVAVMISSLRELLPPEALPHLEVIMSCIQGPLAASKPEETHDARRLRVIFTELTSCKEDSQQRSWMLYEDESTIVEFIKELTSILTNADANISRHVMSTAQYHGVSSLVQYYQMEVRWSIRQLLLLSFGIMCSLDATVVTLMLNSVLPMELARDMRTNRRHIPRLNYSSLLLTMIFSMGEPMPIPHLEHLGSEFVQFLLDLIENPPDTDVEEQIPDLFLNLIISYNLQFPDCQENIMLKSLEDRNVAKTFTEKILLLLNREVDPVRTFDHQPAPPHSVLKLFIDLFSNAKTAVLFYTNDTKVLIDIIVRQLADLSAGDKRRQQYLELCRLVMRNSAYEEHRHRREDMLQCFTRIFCEESEHSKGDQDLVRDISNEFPQYFKAWQSSI